MSHKLETLKDFANLIVEIQRSDRWVLIVGSGDAGEGKSCVTSQLAKLVAKKNNTNFTYEQNMTYRRDELKTWLDGDHEGKGQKPEYSAILADEIISLFFKRNWFDANQIDGIELLNKCRDRHACVLGNIPNFWDLDSTVYSNITFWIHVDCRGIAWIFKKSNNPFTMDKWHRKDNEKKFKKQKNPYGCEGFVAEIKFDDWTEEEQQRYYKVRNEKRRNTEGQRSRVERYGIIKQQRDKLFMLNRYRDRSLKSLVNKIPALKIEEIKEQTSKLIFENKDYEEETGISQSLLRKMESDANSETAD